MITIFCEENLAESRAKVGVKDGVYDRVQQTVEVAEPVNDADQQRREVTRLGTERSQESDDEERKPAYDEGPGYDGQRSGGFAFSCLGSPQRFGLGRGRLRTAEFRQLEVQTRQVESAASMRRGHHGLVHRQCARTACSPRVARISSNALVVLTWYLHQSRRPTVHAHFHTRVVFV